MRELGEYVFDSTKPCPTCEGHGRVKTGPTYETIEFCPWCAGSGNMALYHRVPKPDTPPAAHACKIDETHIAECTRHTRGCYIDHAPPAALTSEQVAAMVEDAAPTERWGLTKKPAAELAEHVRALADEVERLREEFRTESIFRKMWHEQFAWLWRVFFKLDESKGEPWLCNETRTQLFNLRDARDAALAEVERLRAEQTETERLTELADTAARLAAKRKDERDALQAECARLREEIANLHRIATYDEEQIEAQRDELRADLARAVGELKHLRVKHDVDCAAVDEFIEEMEGKAK